MTNKNDIIISSTIGEDIIEKLELISSLINGKYIDEAINSQVQKLTDMLEKCNSTTNFILQKINQLILSMTLNKTIDLIIDEQNKGKIE